MSSNPSAPSPRLARSRRPSLGAFTAAAALLLVALAACSSSSPRPASCSPALNAPSQDSFCTAVAAYDTRCGHCDDCTAKNLQNCGKLGAILSDAYRSAYVSCKEQAPCSDDPSRSACVLQLMQSAKPTIAQTQAKDAYCTSCAATNQSDCDHFFDIAPTTAQNGAGYGVLMYGDTIAQQAITTCTKECDPLRYAVCVALTACGPEGGDYCSDGGLCAGH